LIYGCCCKSEAACLQGASRDIPSRPFHRAY
jgi:hypothetical protein